MEITEIPTHIDDPQHLLLWSADEAIPIVLGLLFGMIIEKALLCMLIGVAVSHQYRKFRDTHPDGFFVHLLYEWGFYYSKVRSFRNPYISHFIP